MFWHDLNLVEVSLLGHATNGNGVISKQAFKCSLMSAWFHAVTDGLLYTFCSRNPPSSSVSNVLAVYGRTGTNSFKGGSLPSEVIGPGGTKYFEVIGPGDQFLWGTIYFVTGRHINFPTSDKASFSSELE